MIKALFVGAFFAFVITRKASGVIATAEAEFLERIGVWVPDPGPVAVMAGCDRPSVKDSPDPAGIE